MERIPEPHELMNEHEQAEAYAASDFTEPHTEFVERFSVLFPNFRAGRVLDIGVGHADIPLRFARKYPEAHILGIDGADEMLALGRKAVAAAGLADRITLRHELLQEHSIPPESFDVMMANSLLHHLEDPHDLWRVAKRAVKPGGSIYVVDLARPESEEEARRLVDLHAANAPELMRRDFFNSLRAAYTPDEVANQLGRAGLSTIELHQVSDRHIVIHGTKERQFEDDAIVRRIDEKAWRDYELIRHQMLRTDPAAFPPQAFADLSDSEEKWRERIRRSDVLIAYDGDNPIGMIRATYDGNVAMLRNMYTNAEYRGRGLGRRLMTAAMEAVAGRGVAVVRLEVEDTQIPAGTMYKSFGFQEVAAVPNERDGFMLTMEKKLIEV